MEKKQEEPIENEVKEEAVRPPEPELVLEIRQILGLDEKTEASVLLLTLKTAMEKAKAAEQLRDELEHANAVISELRRKEEERKKLELLDQGVREGKITPATRPWWEKLDCVQLSAHLPQAPVLIRQGAMERDMLVPDTGALTAEDREVCRLFGFQEEEYLRFRNKMN